eukprot:31514-Pelagococcus_subviridis.AAC.13
MAEVAKMGSQVARMRGIRRNLAAAAISFQRGTRSRARRTARARARTDRAAARRLPPRARSRGSGARIRPRS